MHQIRTTMRARLAHVSRRAALSVLAVTVTVVAGCGSGGHRTSGVPAAEAGRSRTTGAAVLGVPGAITKTQARQLVRKVTLRPADLPGFAASAPREQGHETTAEKRLGQQLDRCVGALGAERSLAEASSPEFTREAQGLSRSVQAEASVAYTSAALARELSLARTGHTRACLARYFERSLGGRHLGRAVLDGVSVSEGTPPTLGTTGSVAWRVTATANADRIRFSLYFDILVFTYGPTEVTLTTSSSLEPFPAAIEERLYSSLVERAKASI